MDIVGIGATLHWIGAGAAVLGCASFLVAAVRRGPGTTAGRWHRAGVAGAIVSAAFLAAAVALLETALVTRDTSFGFVAKATEDALPLGYRITSLWSAMEGSLLLWVLFLAIVAALLVVRRNTATASAASTAMLFVAGFGVVSLLATPFFAADRADVAAMAKPSPLLQDHPAMGIHPPLLYAGFAVLLVPFALAAGALIVRQFDPRVFDLIHRFTLIGWILLGSGIGVGAWWSYAVLGWGGYWAWDPVENASLLPWLAATATLHTVGARTRGPDWRRWAIVLAGLPFVLVLVAVFLTRSGLIASIHAFSVSPITVSLGLLTAAGIALWAGLNIARARTVPTSAASRPRAVWTVLRAGRVTFLLIAAVVLLGTVTPTVIASATGATVSLGAPWYARTLAPVAIALLILMALGTVLRGHGLRARSTMIAAAASAGAAVLAAVTGSGLALAFTVAVAVFVVLTSAVRFVRRGTRTQTRGALLAHVGLALSAVVVVAGGAGSVVERTVTTGEAVEFGPVDAMLVDFTREDRGSSLVAIARVLVSEPGGGGFESHPELRYYPEHGAMIAGPAIASDPTRDVYVSLLSLDPMTGEALVRVAVIPLLPWLWWTGALILLGGVVTLTARRRPATSQGAVSAVERDRERSL